MKITKQDLTLLCIADNGDERRNINGIRVEAEDLIATDGKVLARIHKPQNGHGEPPPFEPFTMSMADIKRAKKATANRHTSLVVTEGAMVKLSADVPTGETIPLEPNTAPYLEWRRVLKNSVLEFHGPPFRVSFDAHTLRKMAEVVEKYDTRGLPTTVTLEIYSRDEAVRFSGAHGAVEGVIMQVRR